MELPAMKMKEYWLTLQISLREFDPSSIESSGEEDNACYQRLRSFLDKVLRKGLELENTITFYKKGTGDELEGMAEEEFGSAKMVSELPGRLSVAFARQVYLPHIQRFQEVEFGYIYSVAANISQKKIDTNALALQFEATVLKHEQIYCDSEQNKISAPVI